MKLARPLIAALFLAPLFAAADGGGGGSTGGHVASAASATNGGGAGSTGGHVADGGGSGGSTGGNHVAVAAREARPVAATARAPGAPCAGNAQLADFWPLFVERIAAPLPHDEIYKEECMSLIGRLRRNAAHLKRGATTSRTVAHLPGSRAESGTQQFAALRQPAAAPKEERNTMSKQLDAVLNGMRSSLQLAPRQDYVVPQGGRGPAQDAKRLNSDALTVTRIAEKILRIELEQVKNR